MQESPSKFDPSPLEYAQPARSHSQWTRPHAVALLLAAILFAIAILLVMK